MPRRPSNRPRRAAHAVKRYRSAFEGTVAQQLDNLGIAYQYEQGRVRYRSEHTYLPDFRLGNGIVIETKGRLTAAERSKHLAIRRQHPDLDLRFVFNRPKDPIRKGSRTTYAGWCDKHGFQWADKTIPAEWLR